MKKIVMLIVFLGVFTRLMAQENGVKKVYYNTIGLGTVLLPSSGFSFSGQIENGYQFNSHLGVGLGIGYERIFGKPYLPVSLNFNYRILDRKVSPFVSGSFAYEMEMNRLNNIHKNAGWSTGLQVGAWFTINKHFSIKTSLGYRRLVRSPYEDFGFKSAGIIEGGCVGPIPAIYAQPFQKNALELKVGLVIQ